MGRSEDGKLFLFTMLFKPEDVPPADHYKKIEDIR